MSLIVTLTSISSRLHVLRHTLISILEQNYKADRVVLCISKAPYLLDKGVKQLPIWLNTMVERGEVEVKWVENTGPYRKLIPVYHFATDDDWIVTCDDDVIYGPDWLSSLVHTGEQHPFAIVCGRARRPVKNPFGRIQSYINWPIVEPGSIGGDLLPIGIAGVLYRKPLLDKRIMCSNEFERLAPKQDDLWFNLARQVAGTSVAVSQKANEHVYPINTPDTLSSTNATNKHATWDKFFTAMLERLIIKFKGYIGISVCDNDITLKKLNDFKINTVKSTK